MPVADPSALFLVEIVVWDPNLAATRTLRFATGLGHVTEPSETPANTRYRACVKQPLVVTRSLFAPRTTKGRSTTGYGDLVLANDDGALDDMLAYGFDGRAITIRRGAIGAAYPGGFTTDLVGTMGPPEITQEVVNIKLRDRQAEVNIPLQPTKYTGAGLGTLEGVADTLKGKPKPVCYGKVFNVQPPCVETAKLIFQVHDAAVQSFDTVYDRGVVLTSGGTYASTTQLLDNALAPSAGQYKTYSGAEGSYFRLGSAPSGIITADVTEGAAASDRTTAQVYKRLLTRSGKTSGDWSASDLTTLDAAANYVLGFWTDQETEFGLVFDLVAESVGAAWYIDRLGIFRIKQLLAPSGSAVVRFNANDLRKPLLRIPTSDPGQGIPTYQTIVRYAKNYTVQDVDVAASVTDARKAFLREEWREAKTTDSTVKTAHPLAIQSVDDSLLAVEADAQAEATRRQGLRGVQRDMFELVVELNAENPAVDLTDVIELAHSRYGLSVVGSDSGGKFTVVGVAPDGEARTIVLTVWGSPLEIANWIDDDGAYVVDDDGAFVVTS